MRRLMETETGYDSALWSKFTDQGYTGIIFPEGCLAESVLEKSS